MKTATETNDRCGRSVVWKIGKKKYLRLTGRQSGLDKMMRVRARYGDKTGWFVPYFGRTHDELPEATP